MPGSLCPVGKCLALHHHFSNLSFPVGSLGAAFPQQLRPGQAWQSKQSVTFNCHYDQQCGAKATISKSCVWFPFSNSYWHTPLPVSILSSLFLHRCFCTLPALSRPLPRALSCLALGKVPFPFSAMAVQRLDALELS